jgi:hypothetical protein
MTSMERSPTLSDIATAPVLSRLALLHRSHPHALLVAPSTAQPSVELRQRAVVANKLCQRRRVHGGCMAAPEAPNPQLHAHC